MPQPACGGTASRAVAEMSVYSVNAGQEYMKNPDLKQEDILELKKWAETKKLPSISDELLILFYHSCMYDMKAAQSCIEVYYELRKNSPEFFKNRDVSRPELQQALTVLQYSCLPVKDQHGYQIIYHGLQQYEANKYVFNDGVKLLAMAIDACLCVEGTVPGYVFLFNMKGVRFSHLMRLSVSSMRKFFRYIQVYDNSF
ncbi:retinol-binding protein pinta-like isoform X2 [Cimex lectularius]|uniref:CRAL-TRIO domain-containing protein n=1 Tax=Cimex lectularius TaxID=79782 RepID=A0A8I6RPB8_CIMLE|nr:retinol-binding protein pinta-like isoform X2 [Cimex lectularius]